MTKAVAEMGHSWVPSDALFGARLALVRQQMGWGNVKEAALACGLPQESWRSWERDNRTPRNYNEVCEKVADRTGCDLFWLMTGRKHPSGLAEWPANQQGTRPDTPEYRHPALAA